MFAGYELKVNEGLLENDNVFVFSCHTLKRIRTRLEREMELLVLRNPGWLTKVVAIPEQIRMSPCRATR